MTPWCLTNARTQVEFYHILQQHMLVAEHLPAADAVPETSKHPILKQAWEFLHSEGHINQGILQGEPADKTACGSLASRTHPLHDA